MVEIHNLKEFNSLKRDLEFKDIIYFHIKERILEYRMSGDHLVECSHGNNELIFEIMKKKKYNFASKCYGYKTNSGRWPSSEENDYAALTRLVKKLYELIEEKKPKPINMFNKVVNRFELMDLD